MLRLWYHESCRVFQDRLVNDEDRNWFEEICAEKMLKDFNMNVDDVIEQQPVIFGDFMQPNVDTKAYAEIVDNPKVS